MVGARITCLNCGKNVPRTYTVCPFCSNNPREVQRPVWEQFKPAKESEDDDWWLVARKTLLFNDGWGEARVEFVDALPGLFHLAVQHIQRFDDDPSRVPRIVAETILGPAQTLALLAFINEHKSEIEREAIDEA